jgi:hypothetical protein
LEERERDLRLQHLEFLAPGMQSGELHHAAALRAVQKDLPRKPISPSALEGPSRCRPLVQAEAAGAVAEVSSREAREAKSGGRGELCEPTA